LSKRLSGKSFLNAQSEDGRIDSYQHHYMPETVLVMKPRSRTPSVTKNNG
jgi:hypothetical protein